MTCRIFHRDSQGKHSNASRIRKSYSDYDSRYDYIIYVALIATLSMSLLASNLLCDTPTLGKVWDSKTSPHASTYHRLDYPLLVNLCSLSYATNDNYTTIFAYCLKNTLSFLSSHSFLQEFDLIFLGFFSMNGLICSNL